MSDSLTDLKRSFYQDYFGFTEDEMTSKSMGDLEREFFESVSGSDPLRIGYPSLALPATFHQSGDTNGTMSAANRVQFARFMSGGPLNRIHYRVGTASGNIAFAIYDSSGSGRSKVPNIRLWTSGSFVTPAAGSRSVDVSPTIEINPNEHWLAWGADNTVVSLHGHIRPVQVTPVSTGLYYFKDAAFPPADPAPGALSNGIIMIPYIIGEEV